jgi:hypothetical protein
MKNARHDTEKTWILTVFLVTRVSRRSYSAVRFERSYEGGARSLWKEVNIFAAITGAEAAYIVLRKKGMANKTDGAIVVVRCVVMAMGHRHKRGQQENQYKERRKVFVPANCVPFNHEHTISTDYTFVKRLFAHDAISRYDQMPFCHKKSNPDRGPGPALIWLWMAIVDVVIQEVQAGMRRSRLMYHTRIGSTTSGIPWL